MNSHIPPTGGQSVVAVIPALNEAAIIAKVVLQLRAAGFSQVVVCDNGSTDTTAAEALRAGAHVVAEPARGYGAACLAALGAIEVVAPAATIILFVDGDGSVRADEAWALVDGIIAGQDLVVGTRVANLQEKRSLTLPQRIGNVLACAMIRAFWGVPVSDLGPFRAIRKDALQRLNMQDKRFGWTVEMQVKAIQQKMHYFEVPVSTRVRVGKSKISGTVKGVIGAAVGIIGMIVRLRWREFRGGMQSAKPPRSADIVPLRDRGTTSPL